MAVVVGPLFSQEARGQFGKSVVFNRRRGQNTVRGYVVPANPQTVNQMAARLRMVVGGAVARRISATDWTYASESMTWIEFLRQTLMVGNVWNSRFVSNFIGPAGAAYDAAVTQYAALATNITDLWDAAAITATAGLTPRTFAGTTVTTGFQLFRAEQTMAVLGYGATFDPDVPVAIAAGK